LEYSEVVANYRNDAPANDSLWRQFNDATLADPVLAAHRRHVEDGRLGFGDPAFHTLWQILLRESSHRFGATRALEIGVYKGQVISLWALIAAHENLPIDIAALSPLAGQPLPPATFLNRLRNRFDPRRRERLRNGDYYADADYEATVRAHFAHHGLDFNRVRLFRGYSTDPMLLARLSDETFHIVYVDGDHTFAGARHDFLTFGPKVVPGGWLVADDAGADLPGSAFWKGHPSVTRAAQVLPELGFRNILNIGHNRVFERVA
jgi:hypothetical protein